MLNAAANALNVIHAVTQVQSSECCCLTRAGPGRWRSSVPLSELSLLGFDVLNGLRTDFISDLLLHSEPSSYARLFSCNPSCFIRNIMKRMLHKETSRLLEYSENVDGANCTELQSWFKCQPRHPVHSGFSYTH